jgi:hypothetical protein
MHTAAGREASVYEPDAPIPQIGPALMPLGCAPVRSFLTPETSTMADRETTILTKIPAVHELSLDEIVNLDRSVLAESLLRVSEYLSIDDTEQVSRFNSAL